MTHGGRRFSGSARAALGLGRGAGLLGRFGSGGLGAGGGGLLLGRRRGLVLLLVLLLGVLLGRRFLLGGFLCLLWTSMSAPLVTTRPGM